MDNTKIKPIDIDGIDELAMKEVDNLFRFPDNKTSSICNNITLNQIMQTYTAINALNNNQVKKTRDQVVASVTSDYIDYAIVNGITNKETLVSELFWLTKEALKAYGYIGSKQIPYTSIAPVQVSALMVEFDNVIGITLDDTYRAESVVLAIYQDDGPNKGIYSFDEKNSEIVKAICRYNQLAGEKFCKDVIFALRIAVKVKKITFDSHMIPVKNGIYDYENKRLIEYSSEYVFLSKLPVNYNPLACNVMIKNDDGTDWDVESWMKSLSDDNEIVDLLWQVIAAVIRSNDNWNKAIFFLARSGNNGKGTLCQLIRNLVGNGVCISMSMDDFDQVYTPEPLLHASLIIGEENSVGNHLEKIKNFKCVVTHDPYLANIKYGDMKDFRFKGLVIQCINDLLRIKDKTGSFARRLLIIPFTKCFTGVENKRIKNEYLAREDVLEYVLFRALSISVSEFSEPKACIDALAEQRNYNDPVRQFWNEFREEFAWELLPLEFLYELYKSWFNRNIPGVTPIGRNNFMNELREVIEKDPDWMPTIGQKRVEENMKSIPELLISEYKLDNWKNPNYTGHDLKKICIPNFKDKYTGLIHC